MNNDYLVTVVIPVYNVEQYIDACLSSVENQTYKNLEILVIDDCGMDNSVILAKKHADKDSRIKIIRQPHNKGLGAARNRALEEIKGDYVIFLDSDDSMPLDSVELLVNRITETGSNMTIGRLLWNKEHKCFPVAYIDAMVDSYLCEPCELRKLPPQKYLLGSACARIYDTKWLLERNIRFEEGIFWEDMAFSLMAWIEADSISVLDNYVYFRTERNDESNPSITQSYGKKKYLDRDRVFDLFCDYLSKKQDEKVVDSYVCRILISRVMATTKNLIAMADEDIADWVQEWHEEHLKRCNERIDILGWNA